jgi:hypothetical protein
MNLTTRLTLLVAASSLSLACGATDFGGTWKGSVERTITGQTQLVSVNETWLIDDEDSENVRITKERGAEVCVLTGRQGSETAGANGLTISTGTCTVNGVSATVSSGELNLKDGQYEAFVQWSGGGQTITDRGVLEKQ